VEALGLGGPELRAAGLRTVAETESVAVMGFADVLSHLPAIRRARRRLLELLRGRPDALFLPIDAPGLNLALAHAAKRLGRRVVYYVAPQVWAWGEGRVRRLRTDVDLLLLLFRFEEDPLRRAGVRVAWVGHPAGALGRDAPSRRTARAALGIEEEESLLALLPGSRRGETGRHLAPMLDAAARLATRIPGRLRVAVSDAGPVGPLRRDRAVAEAWDRVGPIHHVGDATELLRAADAAAVASGTATLEAAALGTPLVIVYRTGRINYEIARRIIRVPRIGLPNLVLGQGIAPELIQNRATGHGIARALAPLLTDPEAREAQRRAFAGLPDLLGGPGSGDRAAEALLAFVRAPSPVPAAPF
jgi:lipid-A-disaccharide synthase